MDMTISVPDNLPDAMQKSRAEFETEARMAMAVKLFERRRISSGMVAQLAGVDRAAFLLELNRYDVPMIDLDESELDSDPANA